MKLRHLAIGATYLWLTFGNPANAQERGPVLAVTSDHGGIVRFDRTVVGEVFSVAQMHCNNNAMDAVPLGFFRIGRHPNGTGETLMTFQCVPALRSKVR